MNLKAETTLSCMVSLGMFSTERGVVVALPGGRTVSALVDRRSVLVDQEPTPGSEVPGRVRVFVVSSENDSVVLELPQAGFTQGPRLKVPKTLLKQ